MLQFHITMNILQWVEYDLSLILGQQRGSSYETIKCGTSFDTFCRIYNDAHFDESFCDCFIPTASPTFSPSFSPSDSPSHYPTLPPTRSPTVEPTFPTESPTNYPTLPPSRTPTLNPSTTPSATPTEPPTYSPSRIPSNVPSNFPSISPTTVPTRNPTENPSDAPTFSPTTSPSTAPTTIPTINPSQAPTIAPTENPSPIPSNAPTFSPSLAPTHAPTKFPSRSPSQLPTTAPTANPSRAPSDAPSQLPTDAPTDSPTKSPTNTYGSENHEQQLLYIYYTQTIADVLSLSLATYAQELYDFVMQGIKEIMNDTSMSSICNRTDPNGIDCELSNYNPFRNNTSDSQQRRRMLNDEYSYNSNTSNGWWQGRIENLKFCVVLQNLMWDPSACDDYYDESVYEEADEFRSGEAEFIAFAPFDIVADENVENFYDYFLTKFNDNGTAFIKMMDSMMKNYSNSEWSTFKTVAVSIESGYAAFKEEEVDEFQEAAVDVMFGLYGFIIFCMVLAVLGTIHAKIIGADNVRVMGK